MRHHISSVVISDNALNLFTVAGRLRIARVTAADHSLIDRCSHRRHGNRAAVCGTGRQRELEFQTHLFIHLLVY